MQQRARGVAFWKMADLSQAVPPAAAQINYSVKLGIFSWLIGIFFKKPPT